MNIFLHISQAFMEYILYAVYGPVLADTTIAYMCCITEYIKHHMVTLETSITNKSVS